MSDTLPQRLTRRVETLSPGTIGVLGVLGIGVPLAGTIVVTGIGDVALVGLAILAGVAIAAVGEVRRRASALPLELSQVALEGRIDGRPVYRFRVRLGHGRGVRDAHAEVVFERADGQRVPLAPVVSRLPVAVGPWTVAVLDPGGRCAAPGAFRVRVSARERGRTWEIEGRWAREALRPGRFEAGLERRRGRLEWDPDAWDAVRPEVA